MSLIVYENLSLTQTDYMNAIKQRNLGDGKGFSGVKLSEINWMNIWGKKWNRNYESMTSFVVPFPLIFEITGFLAQQKSSGICDFPNKVISWSFVTLWVEHSLVKFSLYKLKYFESNCCIFCTHADISGFYVIQLKWTWNKQNLAIIDCSRGTESTTSYLIQLKKKQKLFRTNIVLTFTLIILQFNIYFCATRNFWYCWVSNKILNS